MDRRNGQRWKCRSFSVTFFHELCRPSRHHYWVFLPYNAVLLYEEREARRVLGGWQ